MGVGGMVAGLSCLTPFGRCLVTHRERDVTPGIGSPGRDASGCGVAVGPADVTFVPRGCYCRRQRLESNICSNSDPSTA